MNQRAVILAGGKGTRLRPYTVVFPKPLMPLGDYPIMEVVIRQLARAGFDRVTIAVNHQAEIIEAFFGDGRKWGVAIDYSLEDQPLGTIAPLRLVRDLPENFLVMNGDVLTDLDYGRFFREHVEAGRLFTISSYIRRHRIDYGMLEVTADRRLCGFREKPEASYEVSMGIYMVNRAVLEVIPAQGSYGFDHLMLDLLKRDRPVTVRRFDGYWLDIGRPDDYAQAVEEFESKKGRFLDE